MRDPLPTSETLSDPIEAGGMTAKQLTMVHAPPLAGHLEQLADRARAYVEAASSANTRRAYAADWKHFSAWCRRQNFSPLPADPQVVGLYITACASGTAERGMKANAVSTIERRLSAISWNCAQRGTPLDRKDRFRVNLTKASGL
jgi:hypothetical protein